MRTLEKTINEWNEEIKYGDYKLRTQRTKKWLGYYEFIEKSNEVTFDDFSNDATLFLEKNVLNDCDSIIDIGCGSGKYSIFFAKNDKAVTGVDMNKYALEALEKKANFNLLSNIKTVNKLWEDYYDDKKYDLVFSSMCPFIASIDDITKIESMSNKYCCIISVNRGSTDYVRGGLFKLLPVKVSDGFTTESIWYYDILYLLERNFKTITFKDFYSEKTELGKAIEKYVSYFKIFNYEESYCKPIITKYLTDLAIDGYITESTTINQSLILWEK